jgi:hypothetical protein
MRNFLKIVFIIILLTCIVPVAAQAQGAMVSSTDLIENAKDYDGQSVVFEGEAIGDLMIRGDMAWVNVSDGNNAVGIWMTVAQTKDINRLGDYSRKGDRLRIQGVFNRACALHGGDFDIHATSVEVIEHGVPVDHTIKLGYALLAVSLFLAAAVLTLLVLRKHF